jgi:tetrahydromethanopterin S-methyltransferase subunit H
MAIGNNERVVFNVISMDIGNKERELVRENLYRTSLRIIVTYVAPIHAENN